ncbi:MAG: tRNA (adenosine(37)-N6)-threonylcarbamoyltransferase complex ATPase subunit type 1 TsaE [Elusimicrobia bacterium]|nr:tRNA (adenosine(37)-N6)-threonylcarbamoyltransferase complex ATPase subunit type 1 TsaE [Elusimicrobiota bacterium]
MEKLTTCGKLVKVSGSPDDTIRLGRSLSKILKGPSRNLFLIGDLGSGKTTLLKGLGAGLGIQKSEVVSPTFQLVRKYECGRESLIHLDLYRLHDISEIMHLGWTDMIEEDAVMAVEWADRAYELWPDEGVFIFSAILSEDEREYRIYLNKENVPSD